MSIEGDLPPARPADVRLMMHMLDVITWEAAQQKPSKLQTLGNKALQLCRDVAINSVNCNPFLPPVAPVFYKPKK